MEKYKHNSTQFPSGRPYSADDFDGYQAAPLLIAGGRAPKSVVQRQERLSQQLVEVARYELEPYAKDPVVEFVTRSIATRMQQREGANWSQFNVRLNTAPRWFNVPNANPVEVAIAAYKALFGNGTVRENDIARRGFGMASAEYANLTIVGEFRKELEVPMWDEIGALTGKDATPHYDQMRGLQIIGFDRDIKQSKHIGAMRISMKRTIGELDDGTLVKGRTTAILNTRPSVEGIEQSDINTIREAYIDKVPMNEVPEFQRIVRWMIDDSLNPGVVLARNETTYGFNEEVENQVTARLHKRALPAMKALIQSHAMLPPIPENDERIVRLREMLETMQLPAPSDSVE